MGRTQAQKEQEKGQRTKRRHGNGMEETGMGEGEADRAWGNRAQSCASSSHHGGQSTPPLRTVGWDIGGHRQLFSICCYGEL